jgi:hypothetical protein
MSYGHKLLLVLALAGGAGACARQAQADDAFAQPAPDVTAVDITNRYVQTMDIWEIADGNPVRIGSVGPASHERFVLDPGLLAKGPVEFVAQPMGGGRTASTGSIFLSPGQVLDFNIAFDPAFSSAFVR